MREGDLDVRAEMTRWFIDALTAAGQSWVLLTGSLTDKMALAVRTVDPLLELRSPVRRAAVRTGFPGRAVAVVTRPGEADVAAPL